MITKIDIRNFKLHKETSINTKGLTILTGMNGVGKSTAVQALLLLRQSFMTNDLDRGLNLKGELCDAGVGGEAECFASEDDTAGIKLQMSDDNVLDFNFDYPDDTMDTVLPGDRYENETDKDVLSGYPLFNDNFQYISAFRFGPQKIYGRDTSLVNRKQISKIMGQCEYVVHFLSKYGQTEIPIRELAINDEDGNTDYRLVSQVEMWLRRISPNIKIDIEQTGTDFKLNYKFQREDNTVTTDFSAMNTGFGITYVLPVLAAILSAEKDSLIIIENPEAHIHPAAQACVMELIANAVKNGVQVIIESHSDHIINGSLVAVNKKIISPNMLSIYYFDRNEHEHIAIANELEISDAGQISRPPKGFFDQIDIDLTTLMGF